MARCLRFLLMITLMGSAAWAAESQGEFMGFQLSTCLKANKRCVLVKSDRAVGSHLRPLYTLEKIEIEISVPGKNIFKLSGKQGYIDFETQRVVISEEVSRGVLKEVILDLKLIEISTSIMR